MNPTEFLKFFFRLRNTNIVTHTLVLTVGLALSLVPAASAGTAETIVAAHGGSGSKAFIFRHDQQSVTYNTRTPGFRIAGPQRIDQDITTKHLMPFASDLNAALSYGSTNYYFLSSGLVLSIDANTGNPVGFSTIATNWGGMAPYAKMISAAFPWIGDDVMFFLNDNTYLKYDMRSASVLPGYPKPVDNTTWRGLGAYAGKINAAFKQNSNTIVMFADNDQYITYNITRDEVDATHWVMGSLYDQQLGSTIPVGPNPVGPSPGIVHTVNPGDTLWYLSRLYGVSVSDITVENGLSTTVLTPGQRVRIPTKSPPVVPPTGGPVVTTNCEAALVYQEIGSDPSHWKHMTLRGCQIQGTPSQTELAVFYGQPSANGQPTGPLFFRFITDNSAPQMTIAGSAYYNDGCFPESYTAFIKKHDPTDDSRLRIDAIRADRDNNCVGTGGSTKVAVVLNVPGQQNAGNQGGQGQSNNNDPWQGLGRFLGCAINKFKGC